LIRSTNNNRKIKKMKKAAPPNLEGTN
jgi:hypothetical protein